MNTFLTNKTINMKKTMFTKMLPVLLLFTATMFAFTNKVNAQVTFSIDASVNANVNTGAFTSTGFSLSSGDFLEEYSFNGKKTHSQVTFTYANGTITAKTHSDVTITGPSTATGIGTWKISKGTGAYTGIRGSGVLSFSVTNISTPEEHITQEWSGTIY